VSREAGDLTAIPETIDDALAAPLIDEPLRGERATYMPNRTDETPRRGVALETEKQTGRCEAALRGFVLVGNEGRYFPRGAFSLRIARPLPPVVRF
jgi:hypothetical protein